MQANSEDCDFSEYHISENKKVVDKFKDECNGRLIAEFISLRPKMNYIQDSNCQNKLRVKGVQGEVVKKVLYHELHR